MTDRLVGVDVARCLALLGMVSTHVLASHDPDGSLTRAVARRRPRLGALRGPGRREPGADDRAAHAGPRAGAGRRSLALATRAVLVATIGLALGGLETGIAVILTYYGVLFLMALPFLGLHHQAAAGAGRGLGGRRPGRLPGRAAAPAGTPLRQPRLRPARGSRPAAVRAAVHRLLPVRALARLRPPRHGAGPRGPGQPQAPGLARRRRAGDRRRSRPRSPAG